MYVLWKQQCFESWLGSSHTSVSLAHSQWSSDFKKFWKIYYQVINVLIVGNDSTHRLEIVFEGLYVKNWRQKLIYLSNFHLELQFPYRKCKLIFYTNQTHFERRTLHVDSFEAEAKETLKWPIKQSFQIPPLLSIWTWFCGRPLSHVGLCKVRKQLMFNFRPAR